MLSRYTETHIFAGKEEDLEKIMRLDSNLGYWRRFDSDSRRQLSDGREIFYEYFYNSSTGKRGNIARAIICSPGKREIAYIQCARIPYANPKYFGFNRKLNRMLGVELRRKRE